MRVLLVEDQEKLARSLKKGLELEGYAVDIILDGEGADDYITKPFNFEELLARMRTLLRRPHVMLPVELEARGIHLNTSTHIVLKDGHPVNLTLKEFALLEYFMRNPNQVINREQILSRLWDVSFDSFSNVVDVHVKNLRRKLNDQRGTTLETVYGVGYRFKG